MCRLTAARPYLYVFEKAAEKQRRNSFTKLEQSKPKLEAKTTLEEKHDEFFG